MITFVSSVNGSDQVVLKNPVFGNSETINFKRINRASRGNDLIIKGYSSWEPTFLQRYEWDYMKEATERTAIYAFINRHVGLPVFVTGLYNVTKKVLLLKPDVEASQVGRENHTLILDMQETN